MMFWKHEEPSPLGGPKPPETGLGREHEIGLGLDEHELGPATGPAPPYTPATSPSADSPGMPPSPPGMPSPTPGHQPLPTPSIPPPPSMEKDMQILSAKVDSLKAVLDNINQRLANIERIAQESQHEERY